LKQWVNKPFDQIGLASIHALLEKVETLDELKRLVGTARRMLDEDPANIALRFLSVCARARSAVESDGSVEQESTTLLRQVVREYDDLQAPDAILLDLVSEIDAERPWMGDGILQDTLRLVGSASFVRNYLHRCGTWPEGEARGMMLVLLAADDLRTVQATGFYSNLPLQV